MHVTGYYYGGRGKRTGKEKAYTEQEGARTVEAPVVKARIAAQAVAVRIVEA